MDLEQFEKKIKFLAENFGCNFGHPDWLETLMHFSRDFSDENIDFGFNQLARMTKEEWSKKYGYGGKPAIKDFLNSYGMNKKQEGEHDKAVISLKIAKLLATARTCNNYDFGDKVINDLVKQEGGLTAINSKISSNKKDYLKELEQKLLTKNNDPKQLEYKI